MLFFRIQIHVRVIDLLIYIAATGGLLLANSIAYKLWAEPIIESGRPSVAVNSIEIGEAQSISVELYNTQVNIPKTHIRTSEDTVIYEGSLVTIGDEFTQRWQVLQIQNDGLCKLLLYGVSTKIIKYEYTEKLMLVKTIF